MNQQKFVARSFYRRPQVQATKVPSKVVKKKKAQQKPANDVLCDIRDTVNRSLKEPHFLCTLLVAAALLYSHADDIDSGPLAPLLPKDSTNALVIWIRQNVKKFFGFIAFSPAIVGVPQQHRMLTIVSAALWVLFVPESTVYQYVFQAALLLLVFKVRLDASRWTIAAIAVFAFFGGWLIAGKPHSTIETTTHAPRVKRHTSGPNFADEPVTIPDRQLDDAEMSKFLYEGAVRKGLLPRERPLCAPFPLTWSVEGGHCQCAVGYKLDNGQPYPGKIKIFCVLIEKPCPPSMEFSNDLCRCPEGKQWNALDPYNPFCY